jgi:hypothetical protein
MIYGTQPKSVIRPSRSDNLTGNIYAGFKLRETRMIEKLDKHPSSTKWHIDRQGNMVYTA